MGMSGRPVPPEVWPVVRQALERLPEADRATLRVLAIDTTSSADHLADLVTVDQVITEEAPPYPDSPTDLLLLKRMQVLLDSLRGLRRRETGAITIWTNSPASWA